MHLKLIGATTYLWEIRSRVTLDNGSETYSVHHLPRHAFDEIVATKNIDPRNKEKILTHALLDPWKDQRGKTLEGMEHIAHIMTGMYVTPGLNEIVDG